MSGWRKLIKWVRAHPWMAFGAVLVTMILSTALIAFIAFEAAMALLQFTTNNRFDWSARRARFLRSLKRNEIHETPAMKEASEKLSVAMDIYEATDASFPKTNRTIH